MGMAAGQARFLGLTARKTNVEYEGQQINQQRTTLSNESASYNNQLLGLDVPTAPSTDKFTKTSYVWTANGGTTQNTIQNMVPTGNPDEYEIAYSYNKVSNQGYKTEDTSRIARTLVTGTPNTYSYTLGSTSLAPVTGNALTALQAATGMAGQKFFSFTDSNGVASYYSEDELTGGVPATAAGAASGAVDAALYKIGSHTENQTASATATIESDANGRMTNITIGSTRYALTANSVTDEAGYNDAMSNYDYKKNQYTKTLTDINTKIAVIQAQDKSLELKLKQCDTEHSAIQTEMDAVKKVIDKNVESSFKTFSA